MKTILFLVILSFCSENSDNKCNVYFCKTNEGQKGKVFVQGTYKKGDTIWLNNKRSN